MMLLQHNKKQRRTNEREKLRGKNYALKRIENLSKRKEICMQKSEREKERERIHIYIERERVVIMRSLSLQSCIVARKKKTTTTMNR